MDDPANTKSLHEARRRWMSILALSLRSDLEKILEGLPSKPVFHWIRQPEFGSVVARARANRTGPRFNVGDVSVTRCSLKTDDGCLGVAYVVGRDKRHAALAALIDACLQRPAEQEQLRAEINSLARSIDGRRHAKLARAYSTRVEFSENRDTGQASQ